MQEPMSFVPPPELKTRVARAVQGVEGASADRMPVRARVAIAVLLLPLLAFAVLVARHALFGAAALRLDLGTLDWLPFAARVGGLLAWTVAVTAIAVRAGRGGLGSPVRALTLVAVAAAPLYALATLIAPSRSEDAEACAAVAQLSPIGSKCAVIALIVGGASLAILVRALRGSVPTAPRLRGAALGAAAGLWAGLALVVHCPAADFMHLFVGHVLPVAAFAGLGAILAAKPLRP